MGKLLKSLASAEILDEERMLRVLKKLKTVSISFLSLLVISFANVWWNVFVFIPYLSRDQYPATFNDLRMSGLGKMVASLRKVTNENIKAAAKELTDQWVPLLVSELQNTN